MTQSAPVAEPLPKPNRGGRPTKPADPRFPKRKATKASQKTSPPTPERPDAGGNDPGAVEYTNEPIGLTPDPPAIKEATEADTYYCLTCGQDNIKHRVANCPNCGVTLKW
jgi:hypothetical protein